MKRFVRLLLFCDDCLQAKRQLKSNRLESAAEEDSRKRSEDQGEKADSEDEEDDEDKYADEMDMPGQKFETKQRITVRNLRIREDKAKVRIPDSWFIFTDPFFNCFIQQWFTIKQFLKKLVAWWVFILIICVREIPMSNECFFIVIFQYLYNLDPNSAYYDPKTRSMRENPFQNTGKDDSE